MELSWRCLSVARERIIILPMENMRSLALGNMVSAATCRIYGPNLLSIWCVNGPRPLYSIGERGISLHFDKPLNTLPAAAWCLLSTRRVDCSKLYCLSVNLDRVTSANLCSIHQPQQLVTGAQLLLCKMHLSQCTLLLCQAALLHFADCDNAMHSGRIGND